MNSLDGQDGGCFIKQRKIMMAPLIFLKTVSQIKESWQDLF